MVTNAASLSTAHLQVTDAASCAQWIESLPLTNVQLAHYALSQQLELIRQAGIAPAELLRILEAMREPIQYVQGELAQKYTAKPLPLNTHDSTLWLRALGLWQELIDAYQICCDAHVRGEPGVQGDGALIVQRCLRYTAYLMFDHYRIYRQVPATLWGKLHRLYAYAEQSGFALTPVVDAVNGAKTNSTCCAAYCQGLLGQLANPFALSGRQMELLARLSEKWSTLPRLARQPLPPCAIPAICVDLAGSAGPTFVGGGDMTTSMRYLDLEQVSQTLRQTIAALKQGQTPAALGLGADARQPASENLLMLLYIQWCRAGTGRAEDRTKVEEKGQVCLGIHAAHYFISGRAFRAPGANLSRREENDMHAFGHISERTQLTLASGQSSAVESWDIVNQSNSGFMCMLREPNAQLRLGHNQLVAVRRSSGKQFSVGVVQWMRVEETSEMLAGIRLFPGLARPVAARPANFTARAADHGFERALLLPEVAVPATPATLVLPAGWYQPGRFVEIVGEQKYVAKLVNVIEKGSDFDRCTVTLA